jgi:predicted metal-dependent hydrolase
VEVGADVTLTRAELLADLDALLQRHARALGDDQVEALFRGCGDPLPDAAREAVALFNAGEYYRQHDAFEALWMRETGPVRDLYRSILQVGVAYYQITHGNGRGALKMLLRSQQWLDLLPDAGQGVDVARLRADAAAVRAELERLGVDDIAAFDRALLRPVRLVDDAPR